MLLIIALDCCLLPASYSVPVAADEPLYVLQSKVAAFIDDDRLESCLQQLRASFVKKLDKLISVLLRRICCILCSVMFSLMLLCV